MDANKFSLKMFLVGLAVVGLTAPAWAQAPTAATGGPAVGAVWRPGSTMVAPTGWVPKSSAYIKASNTEHDNQFGYHLAVSGDGNTLVVGAPNENSGAKGVNGNQADRSIRNSGAAYVYTRRGDAWTQQAYLKASNPREAALFGNAVALSADGSTLAVASFVETGGAAGINGDQADESKEASGAVYVFTRTGTTWSQQAYVKASNPGEGDEFGFVVGLSADGNTLAVSAIEEASIATGVNGNQADNTAGGTGAAYVFTRTGTAWSQQAYIKPDLRGALFGYGMAISADGNTLAVGAENEYGNAGAVYAFVRSGTTWSQQGHMRALNESQNQGLGWSTGISGDGNTIVATGPDRDTASGAAYVFVRTGTTWAQQAWFRGTNSRKNDKFGAAAALNGDGNILVVGAQFGPGTGASKGVNGDPNNDDESGSGSVYVYLRNGTTWTPGAYVKAANARSSAEFGAAVSISADGKTLAVGSLRETSAAKGINGNQNDKSAHEAGAAYIFY